MTICSNYMRLWRVIENLGHKEFETLSQAQREVIANLTLNRQSYIILDDSNTLSLIRAQITNRFFVQNGKQVLQALLRKGIVVPKTRTKEDRVQYALGLSNPGFVLYSQYYRKPKRLNTITG